jgi:cytochrome c oxidase subunit II
VKRRALLLGALGLAGASLAQNPPPETIRIVARKFEFVPDRLTLKQGVPVVLELTAPELTMGFSAPALNLSAEIPPGKPVRLAFTPQRAGEFDFACDVFCGEGHEEMSGVIRVVP